jgi:hypothetical protein
LPGDYPPLLLHLIDESLDLLNKKMEIEQNGV